MEPVSAGIGLAVGVASIASIFQTCLHGYRTLNIAMDFGNSSTTLNVQFRVEELRLYLWGRSWGLAIELESLKHTTDSNDAGENSSDGPETEIQTSVIAINSLDEDFDIPGLRGLTLEVLGRISKALEEWKKIGERYGTESKKSSQGYILKDLPTHPLKEIVSQQDIRSKELSTRTKITSKLRWALTDKVTLDGLLSKLTSLNDSLEKLLPKREKTSLARGLAAELLMLLEGNQSSDRSGLLQPIAHLEGIEENKAANIMKLRASNRTEQGERLKGDTDLTKEPSPFANASVWSTGENEDMLIPAEHFTKLDDPKLEYYQQQNERGRWISSRYVPLPRSLAILSPPVSEQIIRSSPDPAPQATLIEWRPAAHESRASQLSDAQLKERRDHIARLLHQTSVLDVDFRVLDCLGYVSEVQGHSPDGSVHDLIGYVYRYPDFAASRKLPVTLRELLGEAYKSENPRVPALEERLRLARSLAIALYQLQCAGWVHRKISSYNILFFYSHKTGELDLSRPYLGGWQYARPDDQRLIYPSERASAGIGDLDMYVHRRRLYKRSERLFPRYRKSFDIYALGIVLIEIAFWEPIMSLATEQQQKKMEAFEDLEAGGLADDWWKSIQKVATEELGAEAGTSYRDAVLFCLEGSGKVDEDKWISRERELRRTLDRNARDPFFEDDDYEEVGIEKEFYWNVLQPLDRIQI